MTSPHLNPLEQLLRLNSSSPEFNDQVSNTLHGEGYRQWAKRISGTDAVRLIDFLDRALDTLDPADSGFRRCLRELRNMCGTRMILPTSYTPPSQDLAVGNRPVASGGAGDVYEGTLNGSKVCVKRVRVYSRDGPEKAKKTLYQEAIMWKRLEHKNIVHLLTITTDPLQLISEWMPGGGLTDFIGKHPDANRFGLVCDVAEGLYYLHYRDIVHGDLKGPNVLVDSIGRAKITDFGLATVTQHLDPIRTAADERGHTARWTAPEILNEEGTYSKEADVFSYAMVMIEVFTGAIPFNHSPPAAAMIGIMKGDRPPRPTHPKFTEGLWVLMQRCWNHDPYSRPESSGILKVLGITIPNRVRASSTTAIAPRQQFSGLPRTSAQRFLSLHSTTSTTSRFTAQVSSQRSDDSSPAFPTNRVGGIAMRESQRTGSYGISQISSRELSSRAPSHPPIPESPSRGDDSANVLPTKRDARRPDPSTAQIQNHRQTDDRPAALPSQPPRAIPTIHETQDVLPIKPWWKCC